MPIEFIKEKCSAPIASLEIGTAPKATVGGEEVLPFLFDEGRMPHAPVIALEVPDAGTGEYPEPLARTFGDALSDPVKYAKKCVDEFGATMLCVRLMSIHPDWGSATAEKAVATVRAIAAAVNVPLIIVGCGDDPRDNEVLPHVSQAMKGRNCLFGIATQNNYKTLAATCLADGHSLIAESPIDINIAKQVNILISDMGFDPKRLIMHPTTTSLGYGMEYVYSIIERSRLAAFIGDKMLAMPFILFVGQETWKTKESKDGDGAQGINWEVATGVSMLQSGGDIVVVQHPRSLRILTEYISDLMKGGAR